MTFACVLRSGGIYTQEWVWALKRGLARHTPSHDFVCLTDTPSAFGMWAVPLEHDWPGWWAKISLFRPGLFSGPVWYLDLDTIILGDLSELCTYDGEFAMLSDFYRPDVAQSGVMAWTPGEVSTAVWEAWMRDPDDNMRRYPGDGQFLHAVTQHMGIDRVQDVFPGQVVSLKMPRHQPIWQQPGPPIGPVGACSHGPRPRLDDPAVGWAHDVWSS